MKPKPRAKARVVAELERQLVAAKRGDVQALCVVTVGPAPHYAHYYRLMYADDADLCVQHVYGCLGEVQHELLHASRLRRAERKRR